jgi:diguanylate cyclase (GGDEF)-like protein
MTTDTVHQRILVVDDSQAIGRAVQKAIELVVDLPVDLVASYAECQKALADDARRYTAAVVDINLPDAPDGQAVDLVIGHNVAPIVLTSSMDPATHQRISGKAIVDYIIKQNPGAFETLQHSVRRILRNMGRKVLVVDDSASFRSYLKVILETQRLQVVEAANGRECFEVLEHQQDVALIVTDYEMPDMDGVHLTAAVRAYHSSAKMGVIGISGSTDAYLGVRFLKAGADDIVRKPFLVEEFVGRVNTCLDHLDNIQLIQEQANRDYLTKLYNRRYLFEAGNTLFNSAKRGHIQLAVAMLDIDHFKRINDSHGHDVGDAAIAAVAKLLNKSYRGTDLVARMGGEEFCVLAVNTGSPAEVFERFRQEVEAMEIPLRGGDDLRMTISIGVTTRVDGSLDSMINDADKALYEAKQGGRNRVVVR